MEKGKVTPAYCLKRLEEFRDLLGSAKRSEDEELLRYIAAAWQEAAQMLENRFQRKGIHAWVPAGEPVLSAPPTTPAEHPLQATGG